MARELVFVYGTLRGGGGAEGMLSGCRWLRPATLRGVLYDLGAFPALVLGGEAPVHGELWSCPPETLRSLDSYEGLDEGLFRRVRVNVDEGSCWVYVAGPALASVLPGAPRLAAGLWPPAAPR